MQVSFQSFFLWFQGLCCLLLLTFTFTVKAQDIASLSESAPNGHIKGVIYTSDNTPIEFVSVSVKGTTRGDISGEDGRYQIRNLKEGTYTLVTAYVGLEAQEKEVAVIAGQTILVDFILPHSSKQLSEVTITDRKSMNQKPVSVGKVAIAPLDLPQSVVTINKEVLEQQQTLRLSEVLQNVAGVYQMGNTGGIQEEVASRGFALGSSNTFKNGVRFNNGVMPEMSALESAEILKGSSALLYGNVSAGGVLNLVTKKPRFENGGEISMRAGSYNLFKPSLDIYGAVNNSDKVAFRLNTTYESADSFRDNVSSERYYVNPSLLIKAGSKTDILLEGDYLHDNRTPDYGVGAVNFNINNIPRSQFLGASWGYYNVNQASATATITHQLSQIWQVRAIAAYQNFNSNLYATSRPTAFPDTLPAGSLVRSLQRSATEEKYYLGQFDIIGKFKTGAVGHQILVGTDADWYRTNTGVFKIVYDPDDASETYYDIINIYNPNFYNEQRTDIPSANRTGTTKTPTNRFGVYVQDMVSVSDKIKVLAGLRYSYQASVSSSTKAYNDAYSPKLGVVYQPTKFTSVFASYSNSFAVNTGTDVNGNALAPSVYNQYEAGVKNELFKGLISANVTAYKIVVDNYAQTVLSTDSTYNPDYPSAKELAGQVTSKGVEFDLVSKPIKGFNFIIGYSYNDTRYTASNDKYLSGSRLRYNPNHTANASIFYTFRENFLRGLNAGVTSYYTGNRLAGRNTTTTQVNYKLIALPDYVQFDAHLGYTLNKLAFRVKVTNLLNEMSYYAHDDNSINPIAPRQFSTTISYKF